MTELGGAGFGAPVGAYAFYVVKIALYVGGFLVFATATPGVGGIGDFARWWADAQPWPEPSRRP